MLFRSSIVLARDIVVAFAVELVGGGLQDAIGAGSVEELGSKGAIFSGEATHGDGVHAIDAEEPSTRAAIFGERFELNAIVVSCDLLGECVDPDAVGGSEIATVLVDEGVHEAEACAVASGLSGEFPGEGVGNELAVVEGMRIVEDPVRLSREAQGSGVLVGIVLVPCLQRVGLGVPGGGKGTAHPDADALGEVVQARDGGPAGLRVGVNEVEAGGLARELLEPC